MKTLRTLPRLLLALWLLLGLALPALATAQGQPEIHIHNLEGPTAITDPNGLPALRVTLDFTLLNANREVMSGIALIIE